jgi:hypothetical protein
VLSKYVNAITMLAYRDAGFRTAVLPKRNWTSTNWTALEYGRGISAHLKHELLDGYTMVVANAVKALYSVIIQHRYPPTGLVIVPRPDRR